MRITKTRVCIFFFTMRIHIKFRMCLGSSTQALAVGDGEDDDGDWDRVNSKVKKDGSPPFGVTVKKPAPTPAAPASVSLAVVQAQRSFAEGAITAAELVEVVQRDAEFRAVEAKDAEELVPDSGGARSEDQSLVSSSSLWVKDPRPRSASPELLAAAAAPPAVFRAEGGAAAATALARVGAASVSPPPLFVASSAARLRAGFAPRRRSLSVGSVVASPLARGGGHAGKSLRSSGSSGNGLGGALPAQPATGPGGAGEAACTSPARGARVAAPTSTSRRSGGDGGRHNGAVRTRPRSGSVGRRVSGLAQVSGAWKDRVGASVLQVNYRLERLLAGTRRLERVGLQFFFSCISSYGRSPPGGTHCGLLLRAMKWASLAWPRLRCCQDAWGRLGTARLGP